MTKREGMNTRECTHTSDWWKQMIPCAVRGEQYSDEEADEIDHAARRTSTIEQQAYIARMTAENEEA